MSPDAQLLNRGKVEGVALAAAGIHTVDIDVSGAQELTLMARMTGAADADLDMTVAPFEGDNTTVLPVNLPAGAGTGPTHSGGVVAHVRKYDVSGFDKVRVRVQNDNAGAQTLTRLSWELDR